MQPPSVSVISRLGHSSRHHRPDGEGCRPSRRTLGLDGLIAGDHVTFHGYGNDGLLTLTAMAAATGTIELKTGVYLLPLRTPSPSPSRPPARPAQHGALSSVSALAAKTRTSIGAAASTPRPAAPVPTKPSRSSRCSGRRDNVPFTGRHFQIEDVTVYPKPFRPLPIFVGGRSDAALRRAGRYGDGYTGIWQSLDRFREAGEKVAAAAIAVGRDPAGLELGMQFWTTVAPSREVARAQVSAGMESMYHLPFERFERYTPFGTARDVAAFIVPYVEAGARHVNLIATQDP